MHNIHALSRHSYVRFATKVGRTIDVRHTTLHQTLKTTPFTALPPDRGVGPCHSHQLTDLMETSLDKGALAGATGASSASGAAALKPQAKTVYSILGAVSFSHLMNDMIQSLIL